jgi:hypothetical protein
MPAPAASRGTRGAGARRADRCAPVPARSRTAAVPRPARGSRCRARPGSPGGHATGTGPGPARPAGAAARVRPPVPECCATPGYRRPARTGPHPPRPARQGLRPPGARTGRASGPTRPPAGHHRVPTRDRPDPRPARHPTGSTAAQRYPVLPAWHPSPVRRLPAHGRARAPTRQPRPGSGGADGAGRAARVPDAATRPRRTVSRNSDAPAMRSCVRYPSVYPEM